MPDTSQHSKALAPSFIRLKGASEPSARLFCFPFAGGSAAVFHGWGDLFPPEIEICAAQPRGRGMRYREPLLNSLDDIVADFLPVVRKHADLPFAFYGHSLGGLLAFELTRRLELESASSPIHLFIGACPPPMLGLMHPQIHHLADEEFLAAIQTRYSGIPEAVLNEPELLEMFLPALKADYAAHETFDRSQINRVACPITVFAGTEDPEYAPALMADWALQTRDQFTQQTVPGNHFFLETSKALIVRSITETLHSKLLIPNAHSKTSRRQ